MNGSSAVSWLRLNEATIVIAHDVQWARERLERAISKAWLMPEGRIPQLMTGQCQTNANQTAKCTKRIASGCQLTPLGQHGGAVLLEDVASAEVAIVVKVIVDRGVNGGEFLQGLDVPEFRHCPFPSSERLV